MTSHISQDAAKRRKEDHSEQQATSKIDVSMAQANLSLQADESLADTSMQS